MKRILLANNDAGGLRADRLLLEAAGHSVTSVESGQEVLDHLADSGNTYDLVITEHDMPRISGMDVLQMVRGIRRHDSLPVIIYSYRLELEESVTLEGGHFVERAPRSNLLAAVEAILNPDA